jgi:hypothetical protein
MIVKHYCISPLFKITILGERDPVLPHEETKLQVENTEVELIVFRTYDHIENEERVNRGFIEIFKHISSAFKSLID